VELCCYEEAVFDVLSWHTLIQGSPNEIAVAASAAVPVLAHLLALRHLALIALGIYFVVKTIYGRHGSSSIRLKTGLRS